MKMRFFNSQNTRAFTLLEVMIAIGIFFTAMFAILELTTQNLRAARSLKNEGPTAGMVLAKISQTNQLYEGSEQGDFGEIFPTYSWVADTSLAGTNGLYRLDIIVLRAGAREPDSTMSAYLFRPQSPTRGGGAAAPRGR
ncbi:MAG: hypothetical protein JWN25_3532 [Verrucomicrobiales bacterium]|nr:hypothetical protein [Verrucomicrobiales bacterium]